LRGLLSARSRAAEVTGIDLPWMAEAKRVLGRHELRDNGWLRTWLRLDGKILGDPAKLPWCGDFVETCIKLALPGEPFAGALGQNPYWARNWLRLGESIAPMQDVGTSITFVGLAVGQILPIRVSCVYATGTTATNLVGLR